MLDNLFLEIALLLWALFAASFFWDRSRYRNCYLLFFAILFSYFGLFLNAGENDRMNLLVITFVAIVLTMLIAPIFLIINGIVMIRREGHSLGNLLSLGLGLAIGVGELATFIAVLIPTVSVTIWDGESYLFEISGFSMFLSWSVFYFSMSFVVFMLYCIFLMIVPRKRDFDYVIIHGAGLLGGSRVSKLLADRLDKAIEVYQKAPVPPVLIPSGGKGSDETISEAEAMAGYLQEKGIPADSIIREDQSTTTFENLANSKAIIDAQGGGRHIALVTSNYHVYRALRYCHRIGLKCVGIGSHVAFYYWPSALIREFIAVHAEKKHFIILMVGWFLFMIPLFLAYYTG